MQSKADIFLTETDANLITGCLAGDRHSQSQLYARYAPKMMVVCLRYARSKEEAEEILQEGFLNVFRFIHQYSGQGSFEGWVRKIMVNCGLQKIRSVARQTPVISLNEYHQGQAADLDLESNLTARELMKLVMTLPPVYKMVFNLYVFEGYKHREIAEMLDISEGTSKSNLSDARNFLQKALKKNKTIIAK